ncbi:hypothetical protein IM687_13970 [Stutzerimonas stutzeri]|uniref:hypothetical protein n=1 Tax=Stutzerimonas stutzeri TaxID=316 RepID=UPI0018ABC590|nr:hypothetical protein [Stutzerimonas stutzeri]QPI08301.1 hypothetical protein IM687_13970 [Stutzerimonas stutzeri]
MSLASVCAEIEAHNRMIVMAQTWGHMEAKPGTAHSGWFTFIHGQHGDMVVIESHFPTFGEGPGYFEVRQDFIWSKVKDGGPCGDIGVYRFDGEYRCSKRSGLCRFAGKVRRIDISA